MTIPVHQLMVQSAQQGFGRPHSTGSSAAAAQPHTPLQPALPHQQQRMGQCSDGGLNTGVGGFAPQPWWWQQQQNEEQQHLH